MRLIVIVWLKLAEVPLIFTVTGPVVALLFAVSVRVLVLVVLDGLKDAVTPPGRPDADRLTLPLKPFCGLTVIVLIPLEPWMMVTLLGDTESV